MCTAYVCKNHFSLPFFVSFFNSQLRKIKNNNNKENSFRNGQGYGRQPEYFTVGRSRSHSISYPITAFPPTCWKSRQSFKKDKHFFMKKQNKKRNSFLFLKKKKRNIRNPGVGCCAPLTREHLCVWLGGKPPGGHVMRTDAKGPSPRKGETISEVHDAFSWLSTVVLTSSRFPTHSTPIFGAFYFFEHRAHAASHDVHIAIGLIDNG